jgi:hypothetical protein
MAKKIKKVIKHLKGDIKTFNKEAAEDKALIKGLKVKKPKKFKEKGKSSEQVVTEMLEKKKDKNKKKK